jgi:hypothetical protein
VDATNAASNFCSFFGLQAENGFPVQQYGIFFGNNTSGITHVGWTVDSCNLTNGGGAIGTGVNITLDNLNVRNISLNGGGGGPDFNGVVENSTVQYDASALFNTFINSAYIGDSSKVSVTSASNVNYVDTGSTNKLFNPTLASGWTTSGTVTNTATCNRYGNWIDFAIIVSATTSVAWTTTATVTIPASAGFASTAEYPVDIVDLTAGTLIGIGNINGSTISMVVAQNTSSHNFCIRGRCAIS